MSLLSIKSTNSTCLNYFILIFQKTVVAPVMKLQFKQNKTIDIWKNMTISELANATGIPVGKLYLLMYNNYVFLTYILCY